ncbi:MAG TPA: methyltransferase domain-containing protein [Streptosporangiales bacterium]
MTGQTADDWDAYAAAFDDEPDHGLRDPAVRAAWRRLLTRLLPEPPARVADLGCGTGSLSVLLAEDGHRVTGVDTSAAMLERAAAKADAAGVSVELHRADAGRPPLPTGAFDVVLSRHVVWALPDPGAALARWVRLLAAGGRLVLVEGRWSTGAGLSSGQLVAAVEPHASVVEVRPLPDPVLWGGPITDERYAVVARRPAVRG